jgi:hypothetical protein
MVAHRRSAGTCRCRRGSLDEGALADVPDLLAQHLGEAAVGAEVDATHAAVLLGGGDDHGAGAVAEQRGDGAAAGGEVEGGGVGLGADDEHMPGHAGADVGDRGREGVEEARALVADVEGGDELGVVTLAEAELLLQVDAAAGEGVLWGEGGEDDEVEVVGLELGLGEGGPGGLEGEVGGADAGVGEAAGLDAGALDDPVVGGLDAVVVDEVVVGDDPRGDVEAGPGDVGLNHAHAPESAAESSTRALARSGARGGIAVTAGQ